MAYPMSSLATLLQNILPRTQTHSRVAKQQGLRRVPHSTRPLLQILYPQVLCTVAV
ncbi:MAG TPA: hypothetical protein VKU38_22060 [Ktedonobacteraceae bacterium]|nr:hypothetical protein [Ktedonobacteraceae bacterium]